MTTQHQDDGENVEGANGDCERAAHSVEAPPSTPLPLPGAVFDEAKREDITSSVGRTKPPPVCRSALFRSESLSGHELSRFCFAPAEAPRTGSQVVTLASSLEIPASSSADSSSSAINLLDKVVTNGEREDQPDSPLHWSTYQDQIMTQTTSRNGRLCQRWSADPQSGQVLRLTAGTVPIMADGRILLVSASRKNEWILPKGGWEADESIEVCALRETFEEAGVFGTIGPKLSPFSYETRKAKKRRVEDSLKKKNMVEVSSSVVSVQSANSNNYHSSEDEHKQDHDATYPVVASSTVNAEDCFGTASPDVDGTPPSPKDTICLATRIRDSLASKVSLRDRFDDTASIASMASVASDGSTSCTHVRMTLMPMYVSEVRDQWPESGRARKMVDIDTAIELMASRPEFRAALIEVKEKGYHLVPTVAAATNKDDEREEIVRNGDDNALKDTTKQAPR